MKASQTEVHRKYCNLVKRTLLRDAVSLAKKEPRRITLLDMACGRGGDIFKWGELGIGRVLAFDVDSSSIGEAIRRYVAAKNTLTTNIRFYQSSAFSGKFIRHTILRGNTVDIVSCMFALHYFSENAKSLSIFLQNVSESLREGGIFVGIAPDSEYISKMISGEVKNDHVVVYPTDLPNSYSFTIRDSSNTDYFAFRGVSTEYLIDKKQFENIANSMGLRLIRSNDSIAKTFPNIYDDYPPHNLKLSPISQLYFSFCFIKTP